MKTCGATPTLPRTLQIISFFGAALAETDSYICHVERNIREPRLSSSNRSPGDTAVSSKEVKSGRAAFLSCTEEFQTVFSTTG